MAGWVHSRSASEAPSATRSVPAKPACKPTRRTQSPLEGAKLDGRERWEGVILNVAEAWDALDALSDRCDDAASRVAGYILWREVKKDEPEGSGGDGQE